MTKQNRFRVLSFAALLALGLTAILALNPAANDVVQGAELRVHFIDVGQGDAILFQHEDGTMLIDAGTRASGPTVVQYLRDLGIERLDIAIGTHPHADHIGGLVSVIENKKIGMVIDPGIPHTTRTFEDYLKAIDEADIKFVEGRAGQRYELGRMVIELLHPRQPDEDHLNNSSVIARVTYGAVAFMMTGDAEREAEQEIVERYGADGLNAQILKVGHHGSRTSTTAPFLDAVSPKIAVIQCGEDNRYGHPHEETLRALTGADVRIYRNDLHGTVVVTTDGEEYTVEVQGGADAPLSGFGTAIILFALTPWRIRVPTWGGRATVVEPPN